MKHEATVGKLVHLIAMIYANGSEWWIGKDEGIHHLFTSSEIINNNRWEFADEEAARSQLVSLRDATYQLDRTNQQLSGILLRKFRLLQEDVIDHGDSIQFRFRRGCHLQLYKVMVYQNGQILVKEAIGKPHPFTWKTRERDPNYMIAA